MTRIINRKTAVALFMALIITFCALMIPIEAFAATTGTIKSSSAKLRQKPSTASSVKILATLKKGASVEIISTSGSYYQVKSGSQTGYVKTSEVTVSKNAASSQAIGKVGKIEIPGLVRNKKTINHDVVCAKDNKYYLDKDVNGKKNVNGSIFMDFRNQDAKRRRNIILYGHNMKDGSMFAGLHMYGKENWQSKYPKIYFTFAGVKYEYEPICFGQILVKNDNDYIKTQFANDAEYVNFIKATMGKVTDMTVSSKDVYKHYVKDGYTPSASDEILTLSTCVPRTIKNYASYKWIVICRKVGTVKS